MKYCPKCGAECPDGQVFCSECGTGVKNVPPVSPSAPSPVFEPDDGQTDFDQTRPRGFADGGGYRAPSVPQSGGYTAQDYTAPCGYSGHSQDGGYAPRQYAEPAGNHAPQSPAPTAPKADGTVSTGAFFGLMLLYSIPIIGFIAAICVACSAKKKSTRNFSLAHILFGLTVAVVSAVLAAVFWSTLSVVIRNGVTDNPALSAGTYASLSDSSGLNQYREILTGDYYLNYTASTQSVQAEITEARLGSECYLKTEMLVGLISFAEYYDGSTLYMYSPNTRVYCVKDASPDTILDRINADEILPSVVESGSASFNGRSLTYELYNTYSGGQYRFYLQNGTLYGIENPATGEYVVFNEYDHDPYPPLFALPSGYTQVDVETFESEFDY